MNRGVLIAGIAICMAASSARAENPTCEALSQALDLAHKRAVLDDILSRTEGRNPVRELQAASNELATMNMNLVLMQQYKCTLPLYPLSIPGPYVKAASECSVAMIQHRQVNDDSPCIITKWKRDIP